MPTATSIDMARLLASFWESLKNGVVKVAYADGMCIRDLVPLLGTFLFELAGDEEKGKDMPLTAVQPGTPKIC